MGLRHRKSSGRSHCQGRRGSYADCQRVSVHHEEKNLQGRQSIVGVVAVKLSSHRGRLFHRRWGSVGRVCVGCQAVDAGVVAQVNRQDDVDWATGMDDVGILGCSDWRDDDRRFEIGVTVGDVDGFDFFVLVDRQDNFDWATEVNNLDALVIHGR